MSARYSHNRTWARRSLTPTRAATCLPVRRAYIKRGPGDWPAARAVVTLGRRYDRVLMEAVAEEFTDSVLAAQAPPEGDLQGEP